MTEEEAKTKWCPFIRITREDDDNFPVSNRGEIKTSAKINFKCIASACMAWRELFDADSVEEPVGTRVRFTKIGGYCGLAGHK